MQNQAKATECDGSETTYTCNNLNQFITQSDDGWKTYTASSYDNRGNLVLEEYHKNKKTVNTVGQYFYDETNKMARGINAAGEESLYSYNGLDYRYVYSDKARLSVVVQGIENGSASVLDDKGELHAYYRVDLRWRG